MYGVKTLTRRMRMKIIRKKLIKDPIQFGIDLGKNPKSKLQLLETEGIIPPCIKIGGGGESHHVITGYYPSIVLDMINEVKELQATHKYAGIRNVIREKYRSIFEIMDILTLYRLYFLDESLLSTYLSKSSLSRYQKQRISDLYDRDLTFKEVKLGILEILSDNDI